MANPLKVLVDLQARRNVSVSGNLEVTGSTTLVGNTSVSSLTASSVMSGTAGYFTGLYVNGVPVSAGGSGTVNTGNQYKLAYYASSGTAVDDAAGLTWDNNTKLIVSGASASAVGLEVTGAIAATGELTSAGVSVTGNISGSGTLQAGGALTVAGAAALNGGLTSTTISGSSTLQVGSSATIANGLTVSAGTSAVQALTATTISGSSTLQAGGAATLANGLTVTGAALDASAVAVSASALNVTNDISARSGSFSGDLLVIGNLTVKGTPTQVESTTVNIGDTNLNLGTGSTDLAVLSGGGIDLGTSAQVQWRYDNANTAWTSNKDINVTTGQAYKINGTSVLSANTLGSGVTASSLTSVGTLTGLVVNGATQITGNLNVSGGYIYAPSTGSTGNYSAAVASGIVHIPQALGLLSDAIDGKTTAAAVQTAYRAVRYVTSGTFDIDGHAEIDLTADSATKFATSQKNFISIDVMVRSGSDANDWQNDLTAVHLMTSGSSLVVAIDALGNEMTHYRLIAVNESDAAFSI